MNVSVSTEKMTACIIPTNTSSIIKGTGIMNGIKKAITSNKTSPANIFPKSLKEKERIFILSDISSKKPRMNFTGPEKFKNLFMYPKKPSDLIEKNCIAKTENKAKAKVVVRSLSGERKSETSPDPVLMKNDPKNPGISSIKFALKIKIKKVEIIGNAFLESSLSPVIRSVILRSSSIKILKILSRRLFSVFFLK